MSSWPTTPAGLIERQLEVAAQADGVERWMPPARPLRVAAVFCAFPTGLCGPGAAGDPLWTAVVVWERALDDNASRVALRNGGHKGAGLGGQSDAGWAVSGPVHGRVLAEAVQSGMARAPYVAGLLGLRTGAAMERALRGVSAQVLPDVLLVDATGRDHPRGAGLAVHLGAVLGLPSVGVTNRVLVATFAPPSDTAGAASPVWLHDRVVGYALRSRAGVNPVIVHAGWRTDAATALAVVRPLIGRWRTPEPLRLARHAARVARAQAEGRYPE